MTSGKKTQKEGRGCVYFNYGSAYALRLLVSIHSLRNFYHGPITVFLAGDDNSADLKTEIEKLKAEVAPVPDLLKSFDRHRLFLDSPYSSTLVLDSDLIFQGPIDELWEPLEKHGVLATRFHAPVHGVDGTAAKPGWANRMAFLEGVRGLLDVPAYNEAVRRMSDEAIDINVGLMGLSCPAGNAFLADWSARMERGRPARIKLLDEMLVVGLLGSHHHFLADERWNCPADEFFRRTNLADARVIHYFGDGHYVQGMRLGRNPATWAGKKWYACHARAARQLNLSRWEALDPDFKGRIGRFLAESPVSWRRHVFRFARRQGERFRNMMRA